MVVQGAKRVTAFVQCLCNVCAAYESVVTSDWLAVRSALARSLLMYFMCKVNLYF